MAGCPSPTRPASTFKSVAVFFASHIAAGSLIYDALKDEPRRSVRLTLGLAGCFFSHWLLDLSPVYHDMARPWDGTQWFIAAYNVAFVSLVATCSNRKRLAWGLAAWLLWDAWWLVDGQGGPHRLTTMFNGHEHWNDPRSFVIEALWIGFVALISLPAIREWHKKRNFKEVSDAKF